MEGQSSAGISSQFEAIDSTAEVLLGRLMTYGAIVRALAAQHSITEREARRSIQRVRERWQEEEPTEARRERRRQLRAAAEDLFREGRRESDRATCLRCLDFLSKLDGVEAEAPGSGLALPEVDAESRELRLRLEAWLASLTMGERQKAVKALYMAEKAVRGATAAFIEGDSEPGKPEGGTNGKP